LPCFAARRPEVGDGCNTSVSHVVPLGQLRDPTGLATWGTRLFVADRGNHRVLVVALIGAVPRMGLRLPVSTGLRKSWAPYAIAADSKGTLYVSDPDHSRLDVFGADGHWQCAWTDLAQITHLAIDADDTVLGIVADGNGVPVP